MLLRSSLGLTEFSLSSGLAGLQFFFFFLVGPQFRLPHGPKSSWAKQGPRGGSRLQKKNPIDNRAKSGPMGPIRV